MREPCGKHSQNHAAALNNLRLRQGGRGDRLAARETRSEAPPIARALVGDDHYAVVHRKLKLGRTYYEWDEQ